MSILCINAGSSSLKVALFEVKGAGPQRGASAVVERIADHRTALDQALSTLGTDVHPAIIGHRVVHGGPEHRAPALVDGALLESLERLVPLAPLHQPAAIAGIRAAAARYPNVPQIACFDTAFHATLPERARRLPLPARFDAAGIRRYGFHGLSFEYVMSTLGRAPPSRIVIAHLGSGASVVAVKDGRSIETSMGLTPTGGVIMGTRTGDIDPGVLVWLARQMTIDELEHLVNHDSGLVALGGTSDMRELLASDDPEARLAVEMFAASVKKTIGAYAAVLGGIDLLVFTGGIGENAASVRAEIARGLEIFGCEVRVVPTDEDLVIARHAMSALGHA